MSKERKTQNQPQAEAVNSASLQAAGLIHAAILTKQEAAAFLRCTVRYIERVIRAGRLRACKPTGKLVRIYRRDLDAFLESGATIGGAQ
jgi:excisionase family DNA binding protein